MVDAIFIIIMHFQRCIPLLCEFYNTRVNSMCVRACVGVWIFSLYMCVLMPIHSWFGTTLSRFRFLHNLQSFKLALCLSLTLSYLFFFFGCLCLCVRAFVCIIFISFLCHKYNFSRGIHSFSSFFCFFFSFVTDHIVIEYNWCMTNNHEIPFVQFLTYSFFSFHCDSPIYLFFSIIIVKLYAMILYVFF